jgi:hypothetical protein
MVTHTITGGGITGGIHTGLAGFSGASLASFSSFTSPISQTIALDAAQAATMAQSGTYVSLVKGANEIRGQIIPVGFSLWTAQLNTSTPGATKGGVQFLAPVDGGSVSYVGAWTGDVAATDSHIHQGGAAGTGGVIVGLTLTPDAGGLAGSFTRAALAGDTDGGMYVNVHTTDAGAGLIRGQVVKH